MTQRNVGSGLGGGGGGGYGPIRPSSQRRAHLCKTDCNAVPVLSNLCPIDQYYNAADKVAQAFDEAMAKSSLDDSYVFGMRFALFATQALPNHDGYNSPNPEYIRLKLKNQNDLERVIAGLERVADMMDAEELERKRREEAERKRRWEELQQRRRAEEAERKRWCEELEQKRRAEEAERKRWREEFVTAEARRRADSKESVNQSDRLDLLNKVFPKPPSGVGAAQQIAEIDSPETMQITRRKEQVENELFQACRQASCSVEKIRQLVQSLPDAVNIKCKEGWIPLHYVCRNKPLLETVQYLVGQCPETAQQAGRDGSLPLHFACCNDSALDVIQYLLQAWRVGIEVRDNHGRLPLHYACRFKGPVQWLVHQWPASVRVPDNFGGLPLHYACRFKAELKVVQFLVKMWPEVIQAKTGKIFLELAQHPFDSAPSAEVVKWLETAVCNVNDEIALAREKAELEMNQFIDGRAFKFVEQVLAIVEKSNRGKDLQHYFSPLGRDDLYYCAVEMLKQQEAFRKAQVDSHVDIAYHYTRSQNLHRIRQDGLLTKADRNKLNISSSMHGLAFGDGVYTGNNPFAFTKYGDCGLMVARLKGATTGAVGPVGSQPHANTVIGNKKLHVARRQGGSPTSVAVQSDIATYDEVVLKSSSQCVALIRYNTSIVTNRNVTDSYAIGAHYHEKLQEVVDRFFNDGTATTARSQYNPWLESCFQTPHLQSRVRPTRTPQSNKTTFPPLATAASQASNPVLKRTPTTLRYVAPETLCPSDISSLITPTPLLDTQQTDCSVCLCPLKDGGQLELAALKTCGHTLHKSCLSDALEHSPKCPVCRKALREPCGKMPSGTMTITGSSVSCQGFNDAPGTFVIQYLIPSGRQKAYHDHPGQYHGKAHRTAYLPNNKDGQALLKRLEYAFLHGLTFTVGRSLTLNRDNCVTWSSIHHKTNSKRGQHGFPDPDYFANCNKDLDALGVPKAVDCP